MATVPMKHRAMWPVVGAFTAAATVVGGWAPISDASTPGTGDAPQNAKVKADPGADGTYESCDAYFGLGKDERTMDIVSFDVSDQNGTDGVDHAVESDTEVIFVISDDEGIELECTPSEITEAEWDALIAELRVDLPASTPLPSYPGPGHYAYPSDLQIEEVGEVIGFVVTAVPAEHTLVSPTELTPLTGHFDGTFKKGADTRVLAYVEAEAGPAARDALESALDESAPCDNGAFSPALTDALSVLRTYHGVSIDDYPNECDSMFILYEFASPAMALAATVAYVEAIVLEAPEDPTEPTVPTDPTVTEPIVTSTTAPGSAQIPASQGATPVAAAPTYTG